MNGPSASSFSMGPPDSYKAAYFFKKCGGFTEWAARYVVLDKNRRTLFYYHTPRDPEPRGAIDLGSYNVLFAEGRDAKKGMKGLKLFRDGAKTYIFCAGDEGQLGAWFAEIQNVKGRRDNQSDLTNPSTMGVVQNGPGMMGLGPMGGMPMQGPGGLPGMPPNFAGVRPPLQMQPMPPMQGPGGPAMYPPGMRPPPKNGQRDDTLVNQNGGVPTPMPFRPRPLAVAETPAGVTHVTHVTNVSGNNATVIPGAPANRVQQLPEQIPHITMIPDNQHFPIVEKDILNIIKIGRLSSNPNEQSNDENFIGFKSRVVSRQHAEIWAANNEFYIRDTKSMSGTFLNAMRLSEPGKESKPFKLNDGDIVQFGVDFRGSDDNEAKCVSMKIQLKVLPGKKRTDGGGGGNEKTIIEGTNGQTVVQGATKVPGNDRTVINGQSTRVPTRIPGPAY